MPKTFPSLNEALQSFHTNTGISLAELNAEKKVLLVFLRHLGCTFCRETIAKVKEEQKNFPEDIVVVFVHQGPRRLMRELLNKIGDPNALDVEDKDKDLYRAFAVKRGNFFSLFGWKTIQRYFQVVFKYGMGMPHGDIVQLPGVFLIHHNTILKGNPIEYSGQTIDLCSYVSTK